MRRRKYRTGARIRRFLAPDLLREVEIVDASEIDDGYVRARSRTWNVLYESKGLRKAPELGEARRVSIEELWKMES